MIFLLYEAERCYLLIPSMLFYLCWLPKYLRANIESVKQVQATLSPNPNSIQNIYQNATTFPSQSG